MSMTQKRYAEDQWFNSIHFDWPVVAHPDRALSKKPNPVWGFNSIDVYGHRSSWFESNPPDGQGRRQQSRLTLYRRSQ